VHEAHLLHELILRGAERAPQALALTYGSTSLTYQQLAQDVRSAASGLVALGVQRKRAQQNAKATLSSSTA